MSQSTSIPRNQQRIRDHGYDDYMEVEKKTRKVMKFQELLHQPNSMIAISRLDMLARCSRVQTIRSREVYSQIPACFRGIRTSSSENIILQAHSVNHCFQIEQEKQALLAQLPQAVTRLRKLLMLSNTGRLRLEHVRIARKEFGLPDDFEFSVVLKYPKYFRLFDAKETRNKYIEVVERDPQLAVCAVENVREREYREKGGEEENVRFSFKVNFPPGFKIGKYYKIAVWKWQRLPYWLPYEDISGYDLRSLEAQKRMEKRAVATIHELLSLTVEKKITLERITFQVGDGFALGSWKDFLLQHQGIFYISTRGNQGKLHTVFLREVYKKES
ncbi:Protein ROOT PRIMORDIUM DEFTIVE 1 [Datura stramonium]|uniref:Protein ROOT PRIMORDIUM DEFTIVE 1 n=1 Tax=Datura stramonium TaxID=4076 RepID=A0ABS8TJ52_DATST|nr:Protein ROOT PRIMORDIUM DEFTIVE 1 [Datura stramonium]